VGHEYTVTWTSTGDVGNVRIDLLYGPTDMEVQLLAFLVDGGSCLVSIPVSTFPSNDYKIRIRSYYYPEIADTSNDSFAIIQSGTFNVTSPNGGEVWMRKPTVSHGLITAAERTGFLLTCWKKCVGKQDTLYEYG
jgi:hypothetical protein